MKLFKKYIILFFITFTLVLVILFIISHKSDKKNQNQPDVLSQIKQTLEQNNIQIISVNYFLPSLHNTEIKIKIPNQDNPLTIVLNTDNSIQSQVNSLQKISKLAKMEDKTITNLDLSINNPYVTLQNN